MEVYDEVDEKWDKNDCVTRLINDGCDLFTKAGGISSSSTGTD
jgi:hypothetical protein